MLTAEQVYKWLEDVKDPEVPVLSILDLGIVREVLVIDSSSEEPLVRIYITPTYSGCPAMDVISMSIRLALLSQGIKNMDIRYRLSPAWTTDWMTESGKQKLKQYGIAPPVRSSNSDVALFDTDAVPCPHCNSEDTELISQFGATSCKALYRCHSCKEPFEHFKCH